ncbi:MAG: GntP family permease [Lachnospiraceae bacterium]|nr:GntP family permease [Lachnospiraceae bacterium]
MLLVLLFFVSIALLIFLIAKCKLHAFLSLLTTAVFFGVLSGTSLPEVATAIASGFGSTMQSIGIVIACGIIIGQFLELTGGAQRISDAILKIIGIKHSTYAVSLTGALVSIPVFCDSGFVILNPVIKGISRRGKIAYSTLCVALMAGLLTTHSFIPPTPGPVAAAALLDADLGKVMLYGIIVAIPIVIVASIWANSRFVRGKYPEIAEENVVDEKHEEEFKTVVEHAPSTFRSFLPIVIPIILIVCNSFFGDEEGSSVQQIIYFLGQPYIALMFGAGLCFLLPTKINETVTNTWISTALQGAAEIILITAAAGSFGKVLQLTSIGTTLTDLISASGLPPILVPYIMSTFLTIAMGSTTVSMTTTSGIMAPLLATLGLSPEIVVMAVAAGGFTFCQANSSYFWCVSKLCGYDLKKGYWLITLTSVIMGVTGIIATCILNIFV